MDLSADAFYEVVIELHDLDTHWASFARRMDAPEATRLAEHATIVRDASREVGIFAIPAASHADAVAIVTDELRRIAPGLHTTPRG